MPLNNVTCGARQRCYEQLQYAIIRGERETKPRRSKRGSTVIAELECSTDYGQ